MDILSKACIKKETTHHHLLIVSALLKYCECLLKETGEMFLTVSSTLSTEVFVLKGPSPLFSWRHGILWQSSRSAQILDSCWTFLHQLT